MPQKLTTIRVHLDGGDERWRWRGHIKKSRAGERYTAQKSSYIGYAGRK